jgi:hypothetical protein
MDIIDETLKGSARNAIRFSLDGLTLNGSQFDRILEAIDRGWIQVRFDSTNPARRRDSNCPLKPDEPAAWDMVDDIMWISDDVSWSDTFRSIIVHEAIHALVDLNRCASTTRATNEVAAYVAQALWLNARGQSVGTEYPLAKKAYDLLRSLGHMPPRGTVGHRSFSLRRFHFESLRNDVLRDYGITSGELTISTGLRRSRPAPRGCGPGYPSFAPRSP